MSELIDFINRFQLTIPPATEHCEILGKSAAVLLPIICKKQPTLLLTQRAINMRSHAGQVAFPGGAADPSDHSLINTALRETYEEVAIQPNHVQILGRLAPHNSVAGYQVTPIIGLIPEGISYRANPTEVASIFEVPLFDALSFQRHKYLDIHHKGKNKRIFFYWYKDRLIWGLTASILHQLALQLS